MPPQPEKEDFYKMRCTQILQKMQKTNCYPAKYHKVDSIATLQKTKLAPREMTDQQVQTAGRVITMRRFGKLNFYEIAGDARIQMVLLKSPETAQTIDEIKRGDIVGFRGRLGATATGELSVFADSAEVLAPCLQMFPNKHFGVKDPKIVYTQRYLDLLLSPGSAERFRKRAQIVKFIRSYLEERDFVEVETPMMSRIASGAAARPFVTHHNEMDTELYMRIAPELYLKQLVIGGFERVFEIGKQFRNEGIDLTHNPEFTTCEFYMAYADYYDTMELVEDLVRRLAEAVNGSPVVEYHPEKRENRPEKVVFDFSKPFRKIDVLQELSVHVGVQLSGTNLEQHHQHLIGVCAEHGVSLEDESLAHVLDKLIGLFIEPQCIGPTFIINHPVVMSPLAKAHRSIAGVTERFELFLNAKEIVNAYSELNDPFDQRQRFEEQVAGEQAVEPDYAFCEALEYGLPPTSGVGIGIDRLTMYLTNAANIKDVILFPAMKE